MNDLKPCPNPECRGECRILLVTDRGANGLQARCRACRYCGPVAMSENADACRDEAERLHNAMSREEEWLSGEPPGVTRDKNDWDIVLTDGGVRESVYRTHHHGTLCWWDITAIHDDRVTHWRPHVAPKGPAR